jgi:hypothetical protein
VQKKEHHCIRASYDSQKNITHVDDSGYRILQENTGNRWNMEAVFRPEIVEIFSVGSLSTSCAFRQELAGNYRENFCPEYCFHGITRNRQFPGRVDRPG